MKTLLSCLVVSMFVLSGLGAVAQTGNHQSEILRESTTFSSPVIQEQEQYVTVTLEEQTSCLLKTGTPMLPVVTKVYTFPFGTTIQDVQVTFSNPHQQVITKPVMPAPAPRVTSMDTISQQSLPMTMDTQLYSSDMTYPTTPFSYRAGAGLDGNNHVIFLSVHFCPVTYTPSTKTLTTYDQASLTITYNLPPTPKTFSQEYDLLIIAPSAFSEALQPLVDYKNSQLVSTKLVTLEEIPSVGADKQEDIKYYIRDAIENWGITYVLLVGAGVKNAEVLPVRYTWVPSEGYEDSFPSDLYYADVYNLLGLFASWDFDGDGKYGEYIDDILAVDLYPDVNIARLPCNDASEVKSVVRKIINFEKNNKQSSTILQIGGDSFVEGDDEQINEGEFANARVMEVLPGYQTTQLWGSNEKLTKVNIILGIYKGVDFVDFNGHGSPISWATHPPQNENVWLPTGSKWAGFTYVEVYWLFNFYKLPVIFINACSTNKFSESDTCLGYSFIKKQIGGGIAAFGASGIGYGMVGSSECDRLFGWMEVHTFENMVTEKIIGDAWTTSVNDYVSEFIWELWDADYKTVEELSLFADPTMAVIPV